MRLSAKFLKNVTGINNYDESDQWSIAEGSAQSLYFQLADKDQDNIRYMSQATVFAVEVTFQDIEETAEIVKTATQPFADDKSIFKIELLASEVPNSGAVTFKLTEDGIDSKFKVSQAISVDLLLDGSC